MSGPVACATCGKELSRHNRSGYCKQHVSGALAQDPEWRAKQKAGAKRSLQANPERLEALRARVRARNTTPERRAAAGEQAKRIGLHAIGNPASNTPESIAKRAQTHSARKLAWCPPHLRDAYRELLYRKHVPASEARAMILAQDAAEVAALRRRMGAA